MKRLLFVAGLLPAFILMLGIQISQADSAAWKTSPSSGDWNTATNWMPPTIPNGPSDTATFATSNRTAVSISANTEVDGIVFNANASAFRVTARARLVLTISGAGITNNSGIAQNFVTTASMRGNSGTITFTNGATAGSGTSFTNSAANRAAGLPGLTEFFDNSTAGNATFINNGGAAIGRGAAGRNFLATRPPAMQPSPTTVPQLAAQRVASRNSSKLRLPGMELLRPILARLPMRYQAS
jgi:hypothetical protein